MMTTKTARRTCLLFGACLFIAGCTKEENNDPAVDAAGPRLILKFKFDSTQVRLNSFGQPAPVVAGHGAQSPVFNRMSAHYVEFAPNATTQLGAGDVVYYAPEIVIGPDTAIDHDLNLEYAEGEAFLNIPLSDLSPGTYQWLRVSLAYQNYDIRLQAVGIPLEATVASFIGYKTYITSFLVNDSTVTVNAVKPQGYWAFELNGVANPVETGQAAGTTVPNPINATSPIPPGSCVVTGAFPIPLTITGNELNDVVIEVSLSTNKSFEWTEVDGDNIFEPVDGENVVDMGIRGMIPTVQ